LAGEIPAAEGEVYVITDGTKLTWRGYFEGLTTALGWPRPWLSIPKPMAWGIASVLEEVYRCIAPRCRPLVTRYLVDHLAHDFYFEITKARRELGYVPAVETAEAIRRTAEWLRMVIEEGRMA
ncbi:MAG: NAD(P)-dependent oxidoreductase, partial [Chloroflexi bacterium]|nr:NAD(P)-dependent oxidoreductase [Chloroflexota bacterium]